MPIIQHDGLAIDLDVAGDPAGPPVLLLHGSVSGKRQWTKLCELLAARGVRVLAPNLRGYGASSAWPPGRKQTLADSAAPVLALCARLNGPLRLVGHSYGAAVALTAARALGARVTHLALYEPMLPGLLLAHGRSAAAAELQALHTEVRRLAAAGDWAALGARFTDYFNGDGAWDASTPQRQQAIAAALPTNLHEWDAGMAPLRAEHFAGLAARVLLLRGERSPAVLREMAGLLAQTHSSWRLEDCAGLGHMAPLTHAEEINRRFADFLLPASAPQGHEHVSRLHDAEASALAT